MIQFIQLQATDCFAYTSLSFNFQTGLHQVAGLNGSSKTSLFLTLIQGLYNKNPKGCKIEDVNNKISGGQAEIRISFYKGKDVYEVLNSRKLGKIILKKNGVDISLKRIPDVLNQIQEVLGCDYQLFCDLVYQSKNSTLNLLDSSTNKGRAEFVNRILKLDELDAHLQRLNDRRKTLEGKGGTLASLKSSLETLTTSLGETVEVEEELPYDEAALEFAIAEQKRLEGLWQEAQAETRRLQELQQHIDTEHHILGTIEELAEQRGSDLSEEELEQVLEQDERQRATLKTQLTKLELLIEQAIKYQTQQVKLQALRNQRSELVEPDKPYEECIEQQGKISKAKATKTEQLKQLKAEQAKLTKASTIGTCPTCGTCVDAAAFAEQLADLDTKIVEVDTFLEKCVAWETKYRQRILVWKDIQHLDTQIDKASQAVAVDIDLVATRRAAKEIEYKLSELDLAAQTVRKDLKLIRQIAERIAKLRGIDLSVDYAERLEVARNNEKELAKAVDAAGLIVSAEQRNKLWHAEYNATVRTKAKLNKQIEENNKKLQATIDAKQKELAAAEEAVDLLKLWINVLGPKGYRTAKTAKFLKSLNSTMRKYAQLMCDGKIACRFYLDEGGEIQFEITDSAKTQDIALWSGGETARIKTVCLFAVLELLEVMGSVSFNVLCLDEVFDALDHEGKEGLFRVLNHLKGRSKAIYTIAHSELALDMMYDSVVRAEKQEDGTTVITQ